MYQQFLQDTRDIINKKLIYDSKRKKYDTVEDISDILRGQIQILDQLISMPDLFKDKAAVDVRKKVEQQQKEQE